MKPLFTLLILLLTTTTAFALGLDQAKDQGLVGETPSGYLAARKASDQVKALVKKINTQRKDHYRGISKRNGAPLESVEKLAGKKLIDRTPKGQYYKKGNSWVKR
jgi:hypothetical protein